MRQHTHTVHPSHVVDACAVLDALGVAVVDATPEGAITYEHAGYGCPRSSAFAALSQLIEDGVLDEVAAWLRCVDVTDGVTLWEHTMRSHDLSAYRRTGWTVTCGELTLRVEVCDG